MPFVRVWTHFVWSTKNREPILIEPYRNLLFEHIKQNAREKGIWLDRVNGYHDHVHCLVSLGKEQSIDTIAQLLKGESSHWFNNRSGFNTHRLSWQNDYFAASVSEKAIDTARAYLENQVIHHKKVSFQEEYQQLMNEYRFLPSDF
jgi:REP element-mobilizing transposase RayT